MFQRRSGGPESVGLPEPARDIWLRTIKAVQAALRETGTPRLGGGTLLAARWQHRKSLDIDLSFEPQGRYPQRIDRVAGRRTAFERTMLELGASEVEPRSARQVLVRFGETTLDVSVLAARPHAGERAATVNGVPATVLSTVQILGGKLERGDRLLQRDAFDPAVRRARGSGESGESRQSGRPENGGGDHRPVEPDQRKVGRQGGRELQSLTAAVAYDAAALGREAAEAIRNALDERVWITTHGRTDRTLRSGNGWRDEGRRGLPPARAGEDSGRERHRRVPAGQSPPQLRGARRPAAKGARALPVRIRTANRV